MQGFNPKSKIFLVNEAKQDEDLNWKTKMNLCSYVIEKCNDLQAYHTRFIMYLKKKIICNTVSTTESLYGALSESILHPPMG